MKLLNNLIKKLFAVVIALNFLDALFTTILVKRYDYSVEQNPLIRGIMELTNSTISLWAWKVLCIAFLWWVITESFKEGEDGTVASSFSPYWEAVLGMVIIIMAIIVAWGGYLVISLT